MVPPRKHFLHNLEMSFWLYEFSILGGGKNRKNQPDPTRETDSLQIGLLIGRTRPSHFDFSSKRKPEKEEKKNKPSSPNWCVGLPNRPQRWEDGHAKARGERFRENE